MRGDSITLRLATAAAALRYEDLPAELVDQARVLMTDTLLVAAAGQTSALARNLCATVAPSAGNCHAWFVDTRAPMAPVDAAFINSLHAAMPGYASINDKVHADIVCLPAAWAMAEHLGSSAADLLLAFVAAIEIVGRLSHHATQRSAGWSHTSLYGCLGAALAAGLLLKLPPEQLADAMGLALAQGAGTQQGSLEAAISRRLQPAFATRNGVFAAQLAAAGATAASQAVEVRFGLRALYEAGDDKRLFTGLWQDWQLLDTSLKPWPVSACSQAAIAATLGLRQRHEIDEQEILQIVAYVSPFMFRYVGAEFSLDGDVEMLAQFNLRYHLATAVLRGPVTFAHLQPEALQDADIARVLRKVHLRVDPRNPHDFAPVTVAFTLRDGRVLEALQAHLPGSRQQPMSAAEFAAKAASCGAQAGIDGLALLERLRHFEHATIDVGAGSAREALLRFSRGCPTPIH